MTNALTSESVTESRFVKSTILASSTETRLLVKAFSCSICSIRSRRLLSGFIGFSLSLVVGLIVSTYRLSAKGLAFNKLAVTKVTTVTRVF